MQHSIKPLFSHQWNAAPCKGTTAAALAQHSSSFQQEVELPIASSETGNKAGNI